MAILPEDMRSVVFLCEERKGKRTPNATGFFIRIKSELHKSLFCEYIVTARHVIRQSKSDILCIRINQQNPTGYIDYSTKISDWQVHKTSDVAVILSKIPPPDTTNRLDYTSIPAERFVGAGPAYKYNGPPFGQNDKGLQVGIGDEIYSPGLFSQRPGTSANLPIARFGHISQMPSEITISIGGNNIITIVAYLAEFVSWGGMSGSPVFWRLPMSFGVDDAVIKPYFRGILGVISGHENIPSNKIKRRNDKFDQGDLEVSLNSGIARITPAEAIRELLASSYLSDCGQTVWRELQ